MVKIQYQDKEDLSVKPVPANKKVSASDMNEIKFVVNAHADSLESKADLVGGKIPTWQIPAVALSEFLGEAGSEAEMLALDGQAGDWCIRTDESKNYILIAEPSNQAANWKALVAPTAPVTSVNGQTGDVVLSKDDIGLPLVPNINATQRANHTGTQLAATISDFAAAVEASAPVKSVAGKSGIVSLVKADVGLDNVDNTADSDKPVSTAQQAADSNILNLAKAYADTLAAGLLDDRGDYDASSNLFPSSGGSGQGGAIVKGDLWYISTGGTLGGKAVEIGASIRALTDNPGQNASEWGILGANVGYVPENAAKKDAEDGYVGLTGFGINFKNNTGAIVSLLANNNTLPRTYQFQNKSGTVAHLDDLVAGDDQSILFRDGNQIGGDSKLKFNKDVAAYTLGVRVGTQGEYSMSVGNNISAANDGTFAGGWTDGNASPVSASGIATFNYSYNTLAQAVGHGANAFASAILGGINGNIPADSPRSIILGGNGLKMPGGTPDTVMLANLLVAGTIQSSGGILNISQVNGLQTVLNGKEGTIAPGLASQYWRGDKTWQTLNKAAVGLPNVDNTSDENKPVSTAQAAAIATRIPLTEKGAINGVATLGNDGKIPSSQLPALAITQTFVVDTEAAQLALDAQEGDVAVRSDLNQSYIRNAGNTGTIADWTLLLTPTDSVLSVNGQTGVVNLTKANIGLSNVDNTSDSLKPVSTAQQAALDNKITKGGDSGATLIIGTTTAHDMVVRLGNNDRWTFDNANGYLRRGAGTASFALELFGTGAANTISFGDKFGPSSPYTCIREAGGIDSDQLEVYGQKGVGLRTGTFETSTYNVWVTQTAKVGINLTNPTAKLHIAGSESGNNNASLKISAGTLGTAEDGEFGAYDGTNFYATVGSSRFQLARVLTASASINFGSTAAQSSSEQTVNVSGASDGDLVLVCPTNAANNNNSCFTGRVSAANTVSVKFNNYSAAAIDPATGTFKILVFKNI